MVDMTLDTRVSLLERILEIELKSINDKLEIALSGKNENCANERHRAESLAVRVGSLEDKIKAFEGKLWWVQTTFWGTVIITVASFVAKKIFGGH